MSTQQEAGAFQPRPGDRLVVRRYIQPTLKPGDPNRHLTLQFSAVLVTSEYLSSTDSMWYFDLDTVVIDFDQDDSRDVSDLRRICDGYVYLKPEYLVTEVVPFAGDQGEAFRVQIGPDLSVVVDASQCIVLEVCEPHGPVIRRVTVPDVGHLKTVLTAARDTALAQLAEAGQRRVAGVAERRRSEGRLTRSEAVAWLEAHGYNRNTAASLTARLMAGSDEPAYGMTYKAPYWVVPVSTDAI